MPSCQTFQKKTWSSSTCTCCYTCNTLVFLVHLLDGIVLQMLTNQISKGKLEMHMTMLHSCTTAFMPCLTVAILGVVGQGYACSSACTFPSQAV